MSAGLTLAILRLGQRKAWHSSCPAPASVSVMKENTWSQVGSAMQYEILGILITLRNTHCLLSQCLPRVDLEVHVDICGLRLAGDRHPALGHGDGDARQLLVALFSRVQDPLDRNACLLLSCGEIIQNRNGRHFAQIICNCALSNTSPQSVSTAQLPRYFTLNLTPSTTGSSCAWSSSSSNSRGEGGCYLTLAHIT